MKRMRKAIAKGDMERGKQVMLLANLQVGMHQALERL